MEKTVRLSARAEAFPVLHGKAVFALELRHLLWERDFDCLAFAFPASLQDSLVACVEKLPAVHALVVRINGEAGCFAPADPGDAYVEGVRQALQRRLPFQFLEDDALIFEGLHCVLPDSTLARSHGAAGYYRLFTGPLGQIPPSAWLQGRAARVRGELTRLEERFERILLLADLPLLHELEIPSAPLSPGEEEAPVQHLIEVETHPVRPEHLYFACGELPFYLGQMEKERMDPFRPLPDHLELLKRLFLETRRHLGAGGEKAPPARLQVALKFLRNLGLRDGRLAPSLFDIVTAAKGVFGPTFAIAVLEAARHYPFFDWEEKEGQLEVGVEHILIPPERMPAQARNLLQDEPRAWRSIELKKHPAPERQNIYRYQWDPHGLCSHVPEDMRIERFNANVRRRSHDLLVESLARSERFTTSLKDGVDIRETLRHWHTGGVYVREIPPGRRPVDAVVVIFDGDHDARYPYRAVFFAEHDQESTLLFYASNPLGELVGPGIAELQYGGLCLLYPPRPIPDLFSAHPAEKFANAAEQLVFGAALHGREKVISYVAAKRPTARMRVIARRFKKRLLWVPLWNWSEETLRRLRKFHLLNGKQVRGWAGKFIQDE